MKSTRKTKQTLIIVEVILYLIILVIMKDIRPWHPRVIDYNMADPDKGAILSFCNFNPLVGWNTMQLHWKSYLANVVLLLPAGFLTGYFVRNRTAYWVLGVGGCVVLELLQLVTQVGAFDILTVILKSSDMRLDTECFVWQRDTDFQATEDKMQTVI